jgi:hypothetical protein
MKRHPVEGGREDWNEVDDAGNGIHRLHER